MVPKGVPGELAHHTVILMEVVSVMGQDEVRCNLAAQRVKHFLYLRANVGEVALTQFLHQDIDVRGPLQYALCAPSGLGRPIIGAGKDNPCHPHPGIHLQEP